VERGLVKKMVQDVCVGGSGSDCGSGVKVRDLLVIMDLLHSAPIPI
jgi:hypothetical protein